MFKNKAWSIHYMMLFPQKKQQPDFDENIFSLFFFKDAEVKSKDDQMADMLKDYQDLMEVKTMLDVEIATYQKVLDGTVNVAGRGTASAGRFVYRYIDQGAIDGAVNASGTSASGTGQVLRGIQSGKIRSYATLMFGAAALLAAVFIVVV